jgi:RHS repeat-associated protein
MTAVNYLWDPAENNIVRELDDTGAVTAQYTTEPGLYGNILSQRRSGQDSYYHYDGQGSTLALTNANGDVADTYAYSAFGELTAQTGSMLNPLQYIGQKGYYKDLETGGYEVRRRSLDCNRGMWRSVDPLFSFVFLRQTLTPHSHGSFAYLVAYAYSHNSPLFYIDPSGLQQINGTKRCSVESFNIKVDKAAIFSAKNDILYIHFRMSAAFSKEDGCCECCEYRQFVRGAILTIENHGIPIIQDKWGIGWDTAGADWERTLLYEEDINQTTGSPYGHRDSQGKYTNVYSWDGCRYVADDYPSVEGFWVAHETKTIKSFEVIRWTHFKMQIIDVCDPSMKVIQEKKMRLEQLISWGPDGTVSARVWIDGHQVNIDSDTPIKGSVPF